MSRSIVIGIGIALLVGGCVAQQRPGKPERPTIVVADGKVQRVDPEPLDFKVGSGAIVIHWDAPAGHRFAGAGIVIEGEVARIGGPIIDAKPTEVGRCTVTGNRLQVQCTNARKRPGIYKYTVLLEKDGQALPPFDPNIVNKE